MKINGGGGVEAREMWTDEDARTHIRYLGTYK